MTGPVVVFLVLYLVLLLVPVLVLVLGLVSVVVLVVSVFLVCLFSVPFQDRGTRSVCIHGV